jgi:hypothetical protein
MKHFPTSPTQKKKDSRDLRPNESVSELMGEGARTFYVLELFHKQILDQNFLLGLNLEQLEKQADEFRWPLIAVYTSNRFDLDGVVNERLRFPQAGSQSPNVYGTFANAHQ